MTTAWERDRRAPKGEWWVPLGNICECGRQSRPAHCHHCGSTFIYGRVSGTKTITLPPRCGANTSDEPKNYLVSEFRCRRCNKSFHEDDPCGAPHFVVKKSPIEIKALQRAMTAGADKRSGLRAGGITGDDILKGLAQRRPDLAGQIDSYLTRKAVGDVEKPPLEEIFGSEADNINEEKGE